MAKTTNSAWPFGVLPPIFKVGVFQIRRDKGSVAQKRLDLGYGTPRFRQCARLPSSQSKPEMAS
jgi:hypothetical protein